MSIQKVLLFGTICKNKEFAFLLQDNVLSCSSDLRYYKFKNKSQWMKRSRTGRNTRPYGSIELAEVRYP